MTLSAPTRSGEAALARCVGDVGRFAAEYWGRRPLLRKRADEHAFEDLFRVSDVDFLMSTTGLRSPAFRLVKDGEGIDVRSYTRAGSVGPQRVYDTADVGRVWSHFADGATIVLQGVQRYWLPLTRFCRDLELALTHPTQTNIYVTPGRERGLGVHYDTHDVFVLQIGGHKHWQVFGCLKEAPLQSQRTPQIDDPGELTLDVELEPGDCLYVPRGWLHEAESLDETSVHLTVGLLAYTWKDVFQHVFAAFDEEVPYRTSLPIGFADEPELLAEGLAERIELVKSWLDESDAPAAIQAVVDGFRRSRQPILLGQMDQVARLDAVSDESVVRMRPGTAWQLRADKDGERVVLMLGDRDLKLPAELEPVLRSLLTTEEATVGDVADLDPQSRLVLVRRLIREGVLEAIR